MGQAPGALQKPKERFSARGDVCQRRREERVRWHGRFSLHAADAGAAGCGAVDARLARNGDSEGLTRRGLLAVFR